MTLETIEESDFVEPVELANEVVESVEKPVIEPVIEVVVEPALGPVVEPVVKPVIEPVDPDLNEISLARIQLNPSMGNIIYFKKKTPAKNYRNIVFRII